MTNEKLVQRFLKSGKTLPTTQELAELDLTLEEYLELWDNENEYSDKEYEQEQENQRKIDDTLDAWSKL